MMAHTLRFSCALVFLALLTPEALGDALQDADRAASFPLPIEAYQDAHLTSLGDILRHRMNVEPFNLWALLMFLGAVVHTFLTQRFRHFAHVMEERHGERRRNAGEKAAEMPQGSVLARVLHFLGEVEAVFGIWLLPLFLSMSYRFGPGTAASYLNTRVHFAEPVFVVVIMTIASTRPVLRLAARLLGAAAGLAGGGVIAWWFVLLFLGPLLGSLITEPAAMTITASLLAARFYAYSPRPVLAYATLGLLFVNISIGGTLTHFAAPPVLMVAGPWSWDSWFMLQNFGWKAIVSIGTANVLYLLWFRKDLARLGAAARADAQGAGTTDGMLDVPLWITLVNLGFMVFAVVSAHSPAQLLLTFLFFLAFVEVTADYQSQLNLRSPILVGFFLAGLVIHGGLQQWWIAPLLRSMEELPLMFGAIGLTAFNDNAAITFLATPVPDLGHAARYAVVAGAVAGGGLTVIANAPNPAGQSILGRYFQDGISPLRLLLAALVPTAVATACFLFLP